MMFTLERLFHLDLSSSWNRPEARYEPLSDEQYQQLFEPIVKQAHDNLRALVRPRCLFRAGPEDRDDEQVAKRHKSSKLWLTLISNTDPKPDDRGGVGERAISEVLLTPASLTKIRSMLPFRLANGLPLLAEVQISLG